MLNHLNTEDTWTITSSFLTKGEHRSILNINKNAREVVLNYSDLDWKSVDKHLETVPVNERENIKLKWHCNIWNLFSNMQELPICFLKTENLSENKNSETKKVAQDNSEEESKLESSELKPEFKMEFATTTRISESKLKKTDLNKKKSNTGQLSLKEIQSLFVSGSLTNQLIDLCKKKFIFCLQLARHSRPNYHSIRWELAPFFAKLVMETPYLKNSLPKYETTPPKFVSQLFLACISLILSPLIWLAFTVLRVLGIAIIWAFAPLAIGLSLLVCICSCICGSQEKGIEEFCSMIGSVFKAVIFYPLCLAFSFIELVYGTFCTAVNAYNTDSFCWNIAVQIYVSFSKVFSFSEIVDNFKKYPSEWLDNDKTTVLDVYKANLLPNASTLIIESKSSQDEKSVLKQPLLSLQESNTFNSQRENLLSQKI